MSLNLAKAPDFARFVFRAMSIAGCGLLPAPALARPVIVPYSVTFTTNGVIGSGSYDRLDLFGGGDLVGLPFFDTMTVIYSGPPWGFYTQVNGAGTTTFTLNDHSYAFSGSGGGVNVANSNFDRRGIGIENADGSVRFFAGVDSAPPLWIADQSAANIFSNNTVVANLPSIPGLFGISVAGNWQTNLNLDATSIQSTYTTTTIDLPEPASWALMLVGFAAFAYAGRRAQSSAHC